MAMSKHLARYIAERSGNGEALVDRLFELGLEMPANTAAEKRIAVAAVIALLERGAGKAAQEVQISLGPTISGDRKLRTLTDEDLEVLARLDDEDPDDDGGVSGAPLVAGIMGQLAEVAGAPVPVTASELDARTVPARSFIIDAESTDVKP
jgi:hypothetical protein